MIIDSEGGKIKFMYLQIILQNKYRCLSSLFATVDYVNHESELLTRFHSGQILHNQHEISNVEVQTFLPWNVPTGEKRGDSCIGRQSGNLL